jgi:dTDP-4-amino-4,6-dideoxygalactose transaminase
MYRFIENIKSEKAFFLNSATEALCLLLESMGVGPGHEVLLQSFTCPAVPSAVRYVGATPVFVDINPTTYNMEPDRIKGKLTNMTKAIIVQHTFGIPAEMEAILNIANKYGLRVIEDACHAFGSRYHGQEIGEFGDAAIYSFGWYKPVVLGMGGAAVVNNPDLMPRVQAAYANCTAPSTMNVVSLWLQNLGYNLLLSPRWFWFMKEIYRRQRDFRNGPRKGKIVPLILGFSAPSEDKRHGQFNQTPEVTNNDVGLHQPSDQNAVKRQESHPKGSLQKMTSFQKKRLFGKLDHWNVMVERQKRIVALYKKELSELGFYPIELSSHLEPVYYKYPVLVEQKKEVFLRAQKEKIEISDMFGSPLYPPERRANWLALGYKQGMCPIAEDISDRIVALPVHSRVQDEDIEKIAALIASSNYH